MRLSCDGPYLSAVAWRAKLLERMPFVCQPVKLRQLVNDSQDFMCLTRRHAHVKDATPIRTSLCLQDLALPCNSQARADAPLVVLKARVKFKDGLCTCKEIGLGTYYLCPLAMTSFFGQRTTCSSI